jgi:ABC-type amino acid transport substrate-binding protein
VGKVHPSVLDNGLAWMQAKALSVYICTREPATWTDATSLFALGFKAFGAGSLLTGPTTLMPTGRKLTTAAISDGTVIGAGLATRWAITDDATQVLLFDNDLATAVAIELGMQFELPAFDVGIQGS